MLNKGQSLGVIDYGTGNLRSVVKAFEHLGAKVQILQNPDKLSNVDALVFPGQGTFDQCMEALERTGFSQTIKEWILSEKPFLGICLGLQVLFEKSEEGERAGLGLFPGFVKKFKNKIINSHPALLPAFPGLNSQKQALDYGAK